MTVIKIGDEKIMLLEMDTIQVDNKDKVDRISNNGLGLLPFSPKLIYFTLNMALYSSLTFTSAYFFERWGLPIYQFGALSSLSIIELIGAMWWGGLADRSGKHREILLACTLMYCVFFCALPVMEWVVPDEDGIGIKLGISTVLLGATYFCMSSFFPLVDSCVLRELKKRNNVADGDGSEHLSFGKQRLWGTVGHAAISVISAQFISCFGWPGMFGVMILTCIAFSLIICTIPDGEESDGIEIIDLNCDNAIITSNQGNWNFLLKFDFILFLFVVLLSGYMRSILSIFLPYHLLIDMHQTPLFVGMTAVFRISAEILIFAYAQTSSSSGLRINDSSLGTRAGEVKMVLFGLAAGVVRVAGYGALREIEEMSGFPLWLVVFLLESLKGISVACLISGAVRLAHDLVPDSASTRAQALVSGTYSGLATGLAGLIGGGVTFILPSHDLTTMFRVTAVGGVIGIIMSMSLMKIIK
jgi:hypothetical protein